MGCGVKLLAVDTATRCQSVALLDGERVVAQSERDVGASHARWLVPTIDELLASTGWTVAQLNGLAVAIGPGSFTGLRIGLATLLGFRTTSGLPLAAVPTLEALAWNVRESQRPLCPILRGRTGEAYWALYHWTGYGVLEQLRQEQVGPVEQVVGLIDRPMYVFGDGWQAYKDQLRRDLGSRTCNALEIPGAASRVSAVSVGLAGLHRLTRGEQAAIGLSPRYIQRSEAELNWERRGRTPEVAHTKRGSGRRAARV